MKRDVLFLCQFFYPEYVSSATLPYDTARALVQAGYTVDAMCGYPKEYADGTAYPKKEEVDGIRIRRLKYLQLGRKSFVGRLINYFSFTFMVLLHLLKFSGYRTVIVYSNPPVLPWVASWAKLLFGTKLVFVAYDLYPEIAVNTGVLRQGSFIFRLMEHINRCVYSRADSVVALSGEMKDYIVRSRPISAEKVRVIPNWYEDHLAAAAAKEDNCFSELTDGHFVVSYFGNMGTAQDMDTIMGAIRLLRDDADVCFLFAGHGNKMQQLKRTVSEENIRNVYIYDFLRGKDFQDALQISDCALISLAPNLTGLCVPSKTYSYMMQGIPLLVIMDDSDISRDAERGAGLQVRNGDSAGLAAAIRSMLSDPEKLSRMRKVSRSLYLEKYTTEIAVQQYVDLFRKLK